MHKLMLFLAIRLLLLLTTMTKPKLVESVVWISLFFFKVSPQTSNQSQGEFSQKQLKDPDLKKMIQFLETGNLPDDVSLLQKIAAQALQFLVVDGILYFVNGRQSNKKEAVVPV